MLTSLQISVPGQGLHDITDLCQRQVSDAGEASETGLATFFIQHTSASLLIQENYDASAKRDLEQWLNRLVPENDPLYTHTIEGPDDMPAHIKSALTATSIAIPVINSALALGTWQGIFLWEHRHAPGQRNILLHLQD